MSTDFRGDEWPEAPSGYKWTGCQPEESCIEFLDRDGPGIDFLVEMVGSLGWRAFKPGFGPESEMPIAAGPETGARGARLALEALRKQGII